MIYVTVGTQLPFDRLIRAMDEWAARHPGEDIFAQIGPGTYQPQHMTFAPFVAPADSEQRMRDAQIIVAHAGMGSVLSALQSAKPIIIVPRSAAAREHRNDHQAATAKWLESQPGVYVAWSTEMLVQLLDQRMRLEAASALQAPWGSPLIHRLKQFITAVA